MRRWTMPCAVALFAVSTGCYSMIHPLPPGVSFEGPVRAGQDVRFLRDLTWVDAAGERHVDQQIFDEVFEIISGAENYLIVDMFLYNDFQGDPPEMTRALSSELTDALIARKRARPELEVVVVSDPVNTVYGGVRSKHFDALQEAGIQVVLTKLDQLRDSNPSYSTFWRLLGRPLGTSESGILPSPFSDESVSILSYLSLLNFKANHRKLVLADRDGRPVALITSANPHDGSSAHGNVALTFGGAAVADLAESELAVIAFSGGPAPELDIPTIAEVEGDTSLQVVTEGKIRQALLSAIEGAAEEDRIQASVFYLSDHGVVDSLVNARKRGAEVQILLDPNKDAFGREKGGIPNRPVAAALVKGGVAVRWCDTHGEQCHAKMMLVTYRERESVLLLGSANFTRRNLQDLNLETSIVVRGPVTAPAIRDARQYLERVWSNESGRIYSTDYDSFKDEALGKRFRYEVEERTGMSTF